MKLKMWTGNLDGDRQGLVIATSKEKARQIIGTSRNDFDGYWIEQPVIYPNLDPGVLYTRTGQTRLYDDTVLWYRGRCLLERTR